MNLVSFWRAIHCLPLSVEELGENPRVQPQFLFSDFNRRCFTWDRLSEIKCILDAGMYRSALILALTVVDICSKIDYPEEEIKKRYEQWFDKNVLNYNIGNVGKNYNQFDCFNGYMCYLLRCRMVHGDPVSIEDVPNRPESSLRKQGYDKVVFRFTTANDSCFFDIVTANHQRIAVFFKSISQLVMQIISNAEDYYCDEPDKSKFFDGCEICVPVAVVKDYRLVDASNFDIKKEQSNGNQ